MEAIEFKTKIKNGAIQIPERYKQKLSNTVKVILINEQQSGQIIHEVDMVEHLLKKPIKLKDFSRFSREDIHERI
jgi:hypothetical protein